MASGSFPSFFSKYFRACCQANHSGLSSLEIFLGRMKGTSAPYFLAIFATSFESVDTIGLLISFTDLANSIDHAIRGCQIYI